MPFTLIDGAGPIVSAAVAKQLSRFDTNCSGSTEIQKC
jgi:hypothetical protein